MMNVGLLVVFSTLAGLCHMHCWDDKSCRKDRLESAVIYVSASGLPCWIAQVMRHLLIIVAYVRHGWTSSLLRQPEIYYNISIAAADAMILLASFNNKDGQHELGFAMRLLFAV